MLESLFNKVKERRSWNCPFIETNNWTVLAFWWSVPIFFATNAPLFLKSSGEKKMKKGNYEAFCFSRKLKKISFPIQQCWVGLILSSVFLNANTHLSKNFYFNISEFPTYSNKYHRQTNIPISSPCDLRLVDVCQIKNQTNLYISRGQTLLISNIYNTSNS